jgi:hypothetical protein
MKKPWLYVHQFLPSDFEAPLKAASLCVPTVTQQLDGECIKFRMIVHPADAPIYHSNASLPILLFPNLCEVPDGPKRS